MSYKRLYLDFNTQIMLKQLERLKIISTYLKETSADAKTILAYLKQNNAEISLRQLQRDLKDVAGFFLRTDEVMQVTKEGLSKMYKITISERNKTIQQQTINTWQLMEQSGSVPLLEQRNVGKDKKALRRILNKVLVLVSGKQSLNNYEIINATNFYTVKGDANFNKVVDDLLKAIRNSLEVKITEIANDFTSDNNATKKWNVKFLPFRIVFHRGDFFIAGIENKKVVVYEIGQFVNVTLSKSGFIRAQYEAQINQELGNRFGITKNINDEVYDIKLEFTSVTGALVSKYHWHHSEKFVKENGNWIMTMRCGINRELVGWLFQWMDNVRVIEPVLLQEQYNQILIKMNKNAASNETLVYKNHFEYKKTEI